MAEASLVISILALVLAGLSAVYAYRQADAAKVMAKNDAARRLGELTPDIEVEVEPVNRGQWYRLRLRLADKGPLTNATVELLGPDFVQFTHFTDGVDRDPEFRDRLAHSGPLLLGDDYAWQLEWPDGKRPTSIRLKITCRGSEPGEVWFMTKTVAGPQGPPRVLRG